GDWRRDRRRYCVSPGARKAAKFIEFIEGASWLTKRQQHQRRQDIPPAEIDLRAETAPTAASAVHRVPEDREARADVKAAANIFGARRFASSAWRRSRPSITRT